MKKIIRIIVATFLIISCSVMYSLPVFALETEPSEGFEDEFVEELPGEEPADELSEEAPEVVSEEPEYSLQKERWDAWSVNLTLQEKVCIGETATFTVSIKNTTKLKLTTKWINCFQYNTGPVDGELFGTLYYNGSKAKAGGKGYTFKAGETKKFVLKGKIPTQWKNNKSEIYVVVGASSGSNSYYGQNDDSCLFSFNSYVKPTSTSYSDYQTKSAYLKQSGFGYFVSKYHNYIQVRNMLTAYMDDSKSKPIPGLTGALYVLGSKVSNSNRYIPQGLCQFGNYYLITAYFQETKDKKAYNSILYVLDKNWKFVTTITLPQVNHNGGIAYDASGDVVWLCGKSKQVCSITGAKLRDTINSAVSKGLQRAQIDKWSSDYKIYNVASCLDYKNKKLWVGTFNETSRSTIMGYNTSKTTLTKESGNSCIVFTLNGLEQKLNGFTMGNSNDVYLSYSYGRSLTGTSHITHASIDGSIKNSGSTSVGKKYSKKLRVPNMNEEVMLADGYLYVLYESYATKYRGDAHTKTNRITAISPSAWNNSSYLQSFKKQDNEEQWAVNGAISEGQAQSVDYVYDAAGESDGTLSVWSFEPDTTGSYEIAVSSLDNDQEVSVSIDVADDNNDSCGYLSTSSNQDMEEDEENVEIVHSDSTQADLNLTGGKKYYLVCSVAGSSKSCSGTYDLSVTRKGEIAATTANVGGTATQSVPLGESSCFIVQPDETGTYQIDWTSEGQLGDCTITDENGNTIDFTDSFCRLEAGKTYRFDSVLTDSYGTADSYDVSLGISPVDEGVMEPDQAETISSDSILEYQAAASGRQLLEINGGEATTVTVYDGNNNIIATGDASLVFDAEEGKTYRLLCSNVSGETTLQTTPFRQDLSELDLEYKTSYEYTGEPIRPEVIVKDIEQELTQDADFAVTYPEDAISVGTHELTVEGLEGYSGSQTGTYEIDPLGTKLSKVKPGKKSFKAIWKKQATSMDTSKITGYQLQYSLKKTFSSGVKTKTINGYKKTYLTVKKLKKKKTYYVRIRTFKTVDGTKYYSSWSAKKAVKVK